LPNHATLGYQNRRLRGGGGGEPQRLATFKIMHSRHISAKIQLKNRKIVRHKFLAMRGNISIVEGLVTPMGLNVMIDRFRKY